MHVVIGSTLYNTYERTEGFLASLSRCHGIERCPIVMLNTGPRKANHLSIPDNVWFVEKYCENHRRLSTSIMWEKIRSVKEFCDEDTIFFNIDDDYHLNEWILDFCKVIFEENPEVNYISPMLYPGVSFETRERVILSGINFALTDSCLGGALVARWSHFYPAIMAYFEEYGIDGFHAGRGNTTFDQEFFVFLSRLTGQALNMYTTFHFSLMQHCNMVSTAIYRRHGLLDHMYGGNYDPRINPFNLRCKVSGGSND